MIGTVRVDEVAWIDAPTMAEIDRIAIDEVGIELLQMMENAGRSLADLTRSLHDPTSATVVAGSGGNGGGGIACARHLHNAGVSTNVLLSSSRERYSRAAAQQLEIVEHMGVSVANVGAVEGFSGEVVVDAMVGYSLAGPLRSWPARTADRLNTSGRPVISLDIPSGLDATTGSRPGPIVKANATLTLCLPKIGMRDATEVGELYLADISIPAAVVEAASGGAAPPFGRGRILQITR